MKRVIIILLIISSINLYSFSGEGSGTEADPYQITTIEQLQEMNDELDAHYILMNDIDASDTEEWNDGEGFEQIGTFENGNPDVGFTGSLDGQGYTISYLFIYRPDEDYVGLFGCVADGSSIDDLTIQSVEIYGNNEIGICAGKFYTYAENNNININNCNTSGTISGEDNAGGFCGNIESVRSEVNISDCNSNAAISGNNQVGGFCGYKIVILAGGSSTIRYCSSDGDVSGNENVGGFCGELYSGLGGNSIFGCNSSCSVSGNENVGGFCGFSNTTLSSINLVEVCFSKGNVEGYNNVGGFCGKNFANATGAEATIENCYSMGSVSGNTNVGGFCGVNEAIDGVRNGICNILYCYSIGEVNGIANVGGFCGFRSDYTLAYIGESYWNYETSGISNSDGGVGRSTEEMTLFKNYPYWDVEDIWYKPCNDYPKHRLYYSYPGEGSGTESDPYQITNICELQEIINNLNAHYIIVNDIDASETEEWYDGLGFEPIGYYRSNDNTEFQFFFDGNGYSISDLYINRPNSYGCGLFGEISVRGGCHIKNTNLVNANVNCGNVSAVFVGSIKAMYSNQLIENCSSSGTVSGNDYVGGFCGKNESYYYWSSIRNSYSSVEINANDYAGGFCGYNYSEQGRSRIYDCFSQSNITGVDYVGGFCGANYANFGYDSEGFTEIFNCYSNSSVIGEENVGGFCGINHNLKGTTEIYESYSIGTVNGILNVGGFCGKNEGNWGRNTISKCIAKVEVEGTEKVGGFCGMNTIINGNETIIEGGQVIHKCRAVIEKSFSTEDVYGNSKVGGFCGENSALNFTNYPYEFDYFGTAIIENCYSIGNAVGTGNNSNNIGGFCGINRTNESIEDFAVIYKCYSIGEVSGDVISGFANIFYGEGEEVVLYSFWDTENSGISDSDIGDGRISSEMKAQTNYWAWDFDEIWSIDESYNYGYPILLDIPLDYLCTPSNSFSGNGSGTQTDPYQITNVCQLQEMKLDHDAYYILMNDIDASDTENWNDGEGFEQIGEEESYGFSGGFDGQGYSIYDLYINRPDENYVGLFGKVSNADDISDVNIENADITGYDYVGILIGSCEVINDNYSVFIYNCRTDGSVAGNWGVGGFCGVCTGLESNTWITDCYSTTNVNGGIHVGGFCGVIYTDFYINFFHSVIIENCYATGNIEGYSHIGGFCGSIYANNDENEGVLSIRNSYSLGSSSGNYNTGGLIGYVDGGSVTNCYWDIEASGNLTSYGGEGKTTEEMKQEATFVNWDFDDVWCIAENYDYPKLQQFETCISMDCPWSTDHIESEFNAIIIAQEDADLQVNNRVFEVGDAIGAFYYDDQGIERCAGYRYLVW
jgi:hypothetical protein